MNLKKLVLGASFVGAGLLAVGTQETVQAAEWTPRTVEDVKADLQHDGNTSSYTVVYGDTLGVIASAVPEVDLASIVAINGIEDENLIFPGNELTFTTNDNGQVEEVTVSNGSGDQTYQVAPETAQISEQFQSYQSEQASYAEQPAQQTEQVAQPTQSGSEAAAKEWIAQRESGGSYTATNGQYWGRYQLGSHLIQHGASPAEQERVADQYVANRYGSWTNAKAAWQSQGWY